MSSLILTPLPSIPIIKPGDDLAGIILDSISRNGIHLKDGDILVITQKIVSKSENRLVHLANVVPGPEARALAELSRKDARLCELILRESSRILRAWPGTVICEHKLGFISANAGIDHSNVGPPSKYDDWVLLLPEDPDRSAEGIRSKLEEASGSHLGVLIIDSHGRAWRQGVVGTSVGLAGIPGLVDMRGKPDLFGFRLRITQIAAADELAAAASLAMGQAAEGTPVIHVRGFPYPLRDGSLPELIRPREQDKFR